MSVDSISLSVYGTPSVDNFNEVQIPEHEFSFMIRYRVLCLEMDDRSEALCSCKAMKNTFEFTQSFTMF